MHKAKRDVTHWLEQLIWDTSTWDMPPSAIISVEDHGDYLLLTIGNSNGPSNLRDTKKYKIEVSEV
jgi:hypothetical protein